MHYHKHYRYTINGTRGTRELLELFRKNPQILGDMMPEVVYHMSSGGWMMPDGEIRPDVLNMKLFDMCGELVCMFPLCIADINEHTFKEYA